MCRSIHSSLGWMERTIKSPLSSVGKSKVAQEPNCVKIYHLSTGTIKESRIRATSAAHKCPYVLLYHSGKRPLGQTKTTFSLVSLHNRIHKLFWLPLLTCSRSWKYVSVWTCSPHRAQYSSVTRGCSPGRRQQRHRCGPQIYTPVRMPP